MNDFPAICGTGRVDLETVLAALLCPHSTIHDVLAHYDRGGTVSVGIILLATGKQGVWELFPDGEFNITELRQATQHASSVRVMSVDEYVDAIADELGEPNDL